MKLIDTNNSKRIYKRNGDQIMTYDLNITFDDNLITGNKTIDTQHKECAVLFGAVAEFPSFDR